MSLSEPFIRRPVMTILVMMAILFFGVGSYRAISVSDIPNVDMPTIEVSVSYPGASPETMANSIATPLEQQFMTIQGIKGVFSSSNTGSTSIVLVFALDRNIDAACTDVQQAITTAQPQLPSNLPNNPTYQKINPAATPILYFALVNPMMTLAELYDYGNKFLGERISMVEGVGQVITYGAPYAARIQVDPEKLAAKQIGIDQVTSALQTGTVDLPLGTLWGHRDDFTLTADGQIFKADGYNELVIKNENGAIVKIKDVGNALDSVQNDKYYMHYVDQKGDSPCLVLAVQRLPGANTVKIIESVNETLSEIQPQLPATLKLYRVYDQSLTILEAIADVRTTLYVSFALVIFVIFFALGKALDTVIPSLVLPLCLCGTLSVMYIIGFSVNILSLLAITLSMGFLVDDAIVVLENTVRHVQMKESAFDAAITAAKEISITVLSMTLCLSAAFIPMIFMGGVVGRLFREFAVTITVAVLISGFISLSLTPMLASRLVRIYHETKKPKLEQIADAINHWMRSLYEPCLHFALRHRIFMLLIGTLSVFGSAFLFVLIPKDFLPPDDVGFIQGYTLARDGTSPDLMLDYHKKITELSMKDPNIETIISINSYTNPNEGILFFQLKPFKERLPMEPIIESFTKSFNDIPGLSVFLSPLPLIDLTMGTTAEALYQYSLTSIDQKTLYDYAQKMTQQMREHPKFSQVSSDLRLSQPQWSFHINRDKASNYNVTASQIENFFQYAYSDNKVAQINADINTYDVLIETLPKFYRDPSVLSKLYIRSLKNALVPLSEIVEAKETVGPLTVNHYNGLPAVNISFNPAPQVPLGESLNALHTLISKNKPPQVHGKVIGTADIFQQSFVNLSYLMLISFFVIYVILGILYESFIHPLTVMSAIPPTLFGGLVSLYLFGQTLSIYSFVGLIMLIGIVMKNGIIMVDFANDAIARENKPPLDAIVEAALIRFRPIMMTTFSALMGAVPIALGIGAGLARTRMSLGICVVGGLLISQVLTLLLTPVLYYYFELAQRYFRALFHKWGIHQES